MTSTAEGHRISEVAARTGFSASALRFYEDHGLVEPGRTAAGYRVYDDRAVERLQFISRGKDLGLSLDEIAELLPAWEGDSCADVAGRLSTQVAEKLAATRARISELSDFAADLEKAGNRLANEPTDGPCGPDCACTAGGHDGPTALFISAKPTIGAPIAEPIACSLGPSDMSDRLEEWRRLADTAIRRDPVEGGVRLQFRADADLRRIAELVAAEQQCCTFFTFHITTTSDGITLDIAAPPEARPMVDELVGAAT